VAATIDIQHDIEPLLSEWERLAQYTKTSPLLWSGWIRAWWHAFGTGRLEIITAYENDRRLTGVLPMRRFYRKVREPIGGRGQSL
jgi:CelD/BcsL family acetyltransferase involved in cellulose biosynthesis